VAIDFTIPEASVALAEQAAAERGGPALVIGSTGFSDEQNARIAAAATKVAIVKSGNYSLGVNMLMGLVRQAAAALPAATGTSRSTRPTTSARSTPPRARP
jgi:4-hydroxy-tetrahydrodipicolinate reductase